MIFAVAHDRFKKYTFDDIKRSMKEKPVLVDIRRMFDPVEPKKKGFNYYTL
jgi:hypothetical protein